MNEWREYILEDAVEKFIDYRGKTPPKTDSGIPLVTAKIVKNGSIQTPNEFISGETYDQWMTRGFPKKNDVVMTTEAPLGEVALLKDENVALAQRIILMRGKSNILDNGFLKYYLQSREGQHLLQSRASGTTVFGIKAAVLKKIPIPIPPLLEQKAITAVLSSLDDKIDLLHRQNKTLEALAQTLFRHWFIDGADDDWEEFKVADLVKHAKEGINPSSKPTEMFLHFSIPAFDNGKAPARELGSEIRSNKYKVVPFSILVSKLNPRFPRIWDIYFHPEPNSICSTEFQVLTPKQKEYYGFVSFLLKSNEAITELQMAASGTSGSHQRVKPEDILNISFSVPNKESVKQFSQMVEPYLTKTYNNQTQINTLEKLRDTLLPKLISGEVRVRQATELTNL